MSAAQVHFSRQSRQTKDQPISFFMQQAVENPGLISLAAGLVDPLSLPGNELDDAMHAIRSEPALTQAALQYGTTQGYLPLRETLLQRTCALDRMAPPDLSLSAENVVITTGSQQLLYLLGEILLDPGDLVITEAPSYFVYQGTLTSLGAQTLAIPMDDDGMRTDILEQELDRLDHTGEIERLRMIYVVDYFQNPSGRTLSLPRRQHLLQLVKKYSQKHRIMILEDAAYRELRYDGEDVPSIKSLDVENEYVLLAMTFSKSCSPGLKTGYGILPDEFIDPLIRLKGNHDFGSNNMTQHLLHRLLQTGAYDRHLEELRNVYRTKRDAMLDALIEEFEGDGVSSEIRWTHPHGGLYVWLTCPEAVDMSPDGDLMTAAIDEGVLYVPGQFCYLPGTMEGPLPANEARLSYGVATPDQLREGIRRLAGAIRKTYPYPTQRQQLVSRVALKPASRVASAPGV